MKILIITLLLGTFTGEIQAQTFPEFFRQKKTQKKYLVQQIAALQVYLGYVNKGYSIIQKGLSTISNLKNGELDLHSSYFNSLKQVNRAVKGCAETAQIIVLQESILKEYKRFYTEIKGSQVFIPEEIDYLNQVFTKLLDDCSNVIDELTRLTTDGKLEMNDDNRLRRINTLHSKMQANYSFVKSFGNEAVLLAASRLKEKNDVQSSRALYGLKNQLP